MCFLREEELFRKRERRGEEISSFRDGRNEKKRALNTPLIRRKEFDLKEKRE